MIIDMAVVAVVLAAGNVLFWHFDPFMPLWRRALKFVVIVALFGVISYFFGRRGIAIASGVALVPLIYVHGIWLPRKGVNGWTGEPRARYYELRGWPPPKD